ncbi:hypothetical protein C8Q80DRAFT_1271349 [Daedaleopsis nitida]|nr:hypothetical protein C8Q80DRAFT_1271349 [Daedaleopsis nitida]
MRFSTILALVASVAVASATPAPTSETELVARSGDGNVSLTRRSGCGSTGPLGYGHYKWYIVRSCTPGSIAYCQVTDASGCVAGVRDKIGSMEVDDPDDTRIYAKGYENNLVKFTCPSDGQVRCQVNFNDRDDGPSYSLRVFEE